MSRILNRPMFRRGGRVDSRGTGITSGLDTPKRGLVDGPGGYAGDKDIQDYIETIQKVKETYVPKPSLSVADYLRIASAGAEIAGAPGEKGGILGSLTAAAKPLSKLGTDIASSLEKRAALGTSEASDIAQAIIKGRTTTKGTTYALEQKLQRLEAALVEIDQINEQLKTADPETKPKLLQRKKILESTVEVISPKSDPVIESFLKSGRAGQFWNTIVKQVEQETKILQEDPKFPWYMVIQRAKGQSKQKEGFAEGGEVIQDSMVETIAQEPMATASEEEGVQPLSFAELRSRLPQEITDDIIMLISRSQQALIDFANIATQKDVLEFNSKYGVELVLPQV